MSKRDDWREIRVELINPANGDRDVQVLGEIRGKLTTGGRWGRVRRTDR